MDHLRIKNLLLACAIMLGLQYCCPLVLKAGDHAQVAEMISLGAKDAECEAEVSADVLFVHAWYAALVLRPQPSTPKTYSCVEHGTARAVELPTVGRFPSAP